MSIDYDALASANTDVRRQDIVERAFGTGDYISVTDALSNRNKGGSLVLKFFDEEVKHGMVNLESGYREDNTKRMFRLFCKRRFDGTEYEPGDIVEWEVSRGNRDRRGEKLSGQQINEMIIRGDRNKLYQKKGFTVDEKGCIEIGYIDAATLLTKFGTHYKSGLSICGKREFSRQKFKDDKDKVYHKNIWYWRYFEVSPSDYEQLPVLSTEDDTAATTRKKPGPKPKAKQEQ